MLQQLSLSRREPPIRVIGLTERYEGVRGLDQALTKPVDMLHVKICVSVGNTVEISLRPIIAKGLAVLTTLDEGYGKKICFSL